VGQSSLGKQGIMDVDAIRAEELFGTEFSMNKAQRLDYGESRMTHAMVFMGVDLDEKGNPVRWRVENSWGKEVGKDGYMVMSDKWFDEYMYQVVVNKKYLSEELRKEWEQKPIVLQPWDPMGSLAE
jgi:bleomycin hydrolase